MKQGDAHNEATKVLYDPEAQKGTLKSIGGSQSDDWNDILANQTVQALWLKRSDPSTRYEQYSATVAALVAIGPKDELEGMMAAQLIAAHNAAMECYRRAMIAEQTFEGRRENSMHSIATAARASRRSRWNTCMCTPVVRLWSGWWRPWGEGVNRNPRINPMQGKLPMHLSRQCGARTRRGTPCGSPAMLNGRCRMHGGLSPGAPKGNQNALKHGRYTADAIIRRREIGELVRAMRRVAEEGE
jgi:hypothetical protein